MPLNLTTTFRPLALSAFLAALALAACGGSGGTATRTLACRAVQPIPRAGLGSSDTLPDARADPNLLGHADR